MTTLAADNPRIFEVESLFDNLPAVATDILYAGSAAGSSSGNARPLVAGDSFLGFVEDTCDNSAGAAGAKLVKIRREGFVKLSITGVTAESDIGTAVYATDDNAFTLTASGASKIGVISRWVSGTLAIVHFYGRQIVMA